MRRCARVAGVVAVLALPLALVACPPLDAIRVGQGDASADRTTRDTGVDSSADTGSDDAVVDAVADAFCGADVAADPHNCGRCGHDCLDGGCASGACQPVVLHTGAVPASIAVSGSAIYVSVQTGFTAPTGYVFRCEASNCEATTTTFAAGLGSPWFSVIRGGSLFWADYGSALSVTDVRGCPLAGCPDGGAPILYTPDAGLEAGLGYSVTAITADSTYLYWGTGAGSTGTILRCVPSDCAATTEPIAPLFGVPFGLATDDRYLYWAQVGSNEVLRCPHGECGGSPEVFAHIAPSGNPLAVCGLAVSGGDVYWTVGVDAGAVYACTESHCTKPKAIGSNQSQPFSIAADDSGVYWTDNTGGAVMHCPAEACTAPTVVALANEPLGIALDDVSVYFTTGSIYASSFLHPGQVLRVAKP